MTDEQIKALRESHAELMRAIKPLSYLAVHFGSKSNGIIFAVNSGLGRTELTRRHCRAAKRALTRARALMEEIDG